MNSRPADALTVAIAQLNPTVGDIDGNADRARQAPTQAARDGADLVAFSELFICGYTPEDLVLKPALQAACRAKIEELARETKDGGPAMLIGTRANLRMDKVDPSMASGGTTALTRLPSARRASTIGEDSSTRRPTAETIFWMMRSRCFSSLKRAADGSRTPYRSTKTCA